MEKRNPVVNQLENLFREIRSCTNCSLDLPMGPRPVIRGEISARICIVGQAPGLRVHKSGIPWDDASGERLRKWLDIDYKIFYDEKKIAILPIGFCYPGTMVNGGDMPPRSECAPMWQKRARELLCNTQLTLLVGTYAQAFYLGDRRHKTMTETVKFWKDYLPEFMPLPHPSWRTISWQKKNSWFDSEVLPEARTLLHNIVF